MFLIISDLTEYIFDPHIRTKVPLVDTFSGGHISGMNVNQSVFVETYDRTNPSTIEFTLGVVADAKVCYHRTGAFHGKKGKTGIGRKVIDATARILAITALK